MPDFSLTENDRKPDLRVQLLSNGEPIDLTNATSVYFVMSKGGLKVVDAACTVENASLGIVRYPWAVSDTSEPGFFEAGFQIIWPTNLPQTVPSEDRFVVQIRDAKDTVVDS